MPDVHVICRGRANLTAVGMPRFESGFWDIDLGLARRAIGGTLYLHEAKSQPSYFGGRILDVKPAEVDAARAKLDGELAGKIAAAEKAIHATRSKALAGVSELATDIAADIVSQLTGTRVTKTDAAKAVAKAQGI